MPDRENVIRELENLGAWHTHHYAPFHYEAAETIHDALSLLREQEAVKPKEIFLNLGDGSDPYLFGWECGSCGGWLPFSSNNYCPKCGRKVLWNA